MHSPNEIEVLKRLTLDDIATWVALHCRETGWMDELNRITFHHTTKYKQRGLQNIKY